MVFQAYERIDGNSAPLLQDELVGLIANGERDLTVDFSATKYVSSAGLRAVLTAHKEMTNVGGSFVLCGVSATLKEILDVTGFSGFLTFMD
ncbi:MAG: STAS domain-containing protein [Lachnospiraceae bacterium]|nr:STAS domain-containing protein [Lachnospiraceae bacterium]